MENCYYHGKVLCTFDLKDNKGFYYEEKVLAWKEAAAERVLTCTECGAPVYLAAGTIKEPYFAHYNIERCDYGSGQESEELKKGKRLLYHFLKRSFPEYDIHAGYQLENGMYASMFCSDGNHSIVIDYRLLNNSLEKFRERDNYYKAKQFTAVYILGKRQEKDTKQLDWYQNLIQASIGYLAFLDTKKEVLTLKRSISYRLGSRRKFKDCVRSYPIADLKLAEDGRILCDFDETCDKIEEEIRQEKDRYKVRQDKLRALQEEKLKLEEQEKARMEAYHRAQVLEKAKQLTAAQILAMGLNPTIFHKCIGMIEEGNGHLVADKYFNKIYL